MSSRQIISAVVAPLYNKASFTSEMVTQGLIWETISILDQKDNWLRVKMEDEYEGWLHSFYLSKSKNETQTTLRLTNRFSPIREKRGRETQILALLSFGTIVPLIEKTSDYCKILLINGTEGFIPSQHDYLKSRDGIIKIATSLIGTPYLWGGKSSFGYDCSGFIQMVLKSVGISMPRDTSQQADFESLEEISMDDAKRGDLIFFSENNRINHVAFIAGEGNILHCSGEVKLESIIEGKAKFNGTLAPLNNTFRSISKMLQD